MSRPTISVYLNQQLHDELQAEATRTERSVSELIRRAWKLSRQEIAKIPPKSSGYSWSKDLPEGSTLRDVAQAAGFDVRTIQARLRRGDTLQEALSKTPKRCGVAEKARSFGVDPLLAHRRLHHGWSLERAVSTPNMRPNSRPGLVKCGTLGGRPNG